MLRLRIDDNLVEAPSGYTLLQAAREHKIPIPTLCDHKALLPYGACRLCLVELVGPQGSKLVASCAYPCEEGLSVRTRSELVISARRTVVELLVATGAHLPLLDSIRQELGVAQPYVDLPEDDCVLCGLCVRACRDLVGVGAISLTHRGMDRTVSTPFQISSSDCIECGTCALVCPTGAIHIEEITRPIRTSHTWGSVFVRRACRLCELDLPVPPFPPSLADYQDLLGPLEANAS